MPLCCWAWFGSLQLSSAQLTRRFRASSISKTQVAAFLICRQTATFQLLLVSFDFMIHLLLSVLGFSAVQRMDHCSLAIGRVLVDCMCVCVGVCVCVCACVCVCVGQGN